MRHAHWPMAGQKMHQEHQDDRIESDSAPDEPGGALADDPAWRITAWVLPLGAAASALLGAAQARAGTLDAPLGHAAVLALAALCVGLVRDAIRRMRTERWARSEVHELLLPLGLLLATLVLLAHAGSVVTCAPTLLVLLPVCWEVAHLVPVERVQRLFPHALPMASDSAELGTDADDAEDVVEAIVRDVLDGLPPDIAQRLEAWSIEVREELRPRPVNEIVFGMCFTTAHVIAIYRRPHLRYGGRGERLREAITYTVLHEIGHALGLDEIGVRRLGWLATPAPESAPR